VKDTTELRIAPGWVAQVKALLIGRGLEDAWENGELEVYDVQGTATTCLFVRRKTS